MKLIRIIYIGFKMLLSSINLKLIINTIKYSYFYEGIYDLMEMWNEENDNKEREYILFDLKELIKEIKVY